MQKLEEVKNKAKEVHGDKYDYSLITEYKNDRIKYPIICKTHGVFYKCFNKHIHMAQGCPKCSGRFRYDTESFKETIKDLKNLEDVSFEKLKYVNNKTKVVLTCHRKDEYGNEHGDFEMTPGHILSGEGCPKCRYIKSASSKRRNLDEVISLSKDKLPSVLNTFLEIPVALYKARSTLAKSSEVVVVFLSDISILSTSAKVVNTSTPIAFYNINTALL